MFIFFGFIIALAFLGIAFLFLRKIPYYLPERRKMRGAAGPSLQSINKSVKEYKEAPVLPAKKFSTNIFRKKASVASASSLSIFTKRKFSQNEDFWINLIKSNPQNAYPYKKLGELYEEDQKLKEAREAFRYALRLSPSDKSIQEHLRTLK